MHLSPTLTVKGPRIVDPYGKAPLILGRSHPICRVAVQNPTTPPNDGSRMIPVVGSMNIALRLS